MTKLPYDAFSAADSDDLDDDNTGTDTTKDTAPAKPKGESADRAFAAEVIEAALSRKDRALFQRRPGIFILQVPHANWVFCFPRALRTLYGPLTIQAVPKRVKIGGVFRPVGADDLDLFFRGVSFIYITPDPTEMLDSAVVAAADLTVVLPPVTPELLRKVIRRVTGGVARGVTAEMASLALPVILSVVRPDLSASQCVANLRRAVQRKTVKPQSVGPLLSDLPLTKTVRSWSHQLLADLEAVKTGAMPPDALVYGLLEGPPGTGKTLIAESLARTAGWAFIPSSIGDWFAQSDGALGGVAKTLRTFIDQIQANEPAVGFLDELDALPSRDTLDNRAREWWTTIITLFLTEIDRLKKSGKKVILLGATNYYARLDPALIRPGRLQQRVPVLPPQTDDELLAVLRHYLPDELAEAELAKLVRLGMGATPAVVEGWSKQAKGLARAEHRPLALADVMAQMVPTDTRSAADIRAIAIHEIGHVFAAYRLGHTIESVSIIPTGPSEGWTQTKSPTAIITMNRREDEVIIALAGRAADIVLGDGPNSGAEADLAHATELLVAARDRQGLYDELVYAPALGARSSTPRNLVEPDLQRLLKRATTMIRADREVVLALAERLMAEKVLTGADIHQVLDNTPLSAGPMRRRRGNQALPGGTGQQQASVTDKDKGQNHVG